MATLTPFLLIQRHLDTILEHLSGSLDGNVESVHQARIATRRLREVLPLAFPPTRRGKKDKADEPSRISRKVRNAGRHLGRVRELDVMDALLDRASERMPSTADVVAEARRTLRKRLHDERRDMVKALERLKLDRLGDAVEKSRSVWTRAPLHLLRGSNWVDLLWARIAARAAEAADAVRKAPGVYLPNRSHEARIAVKKLRYSVEVALDAGLWQADRLLKDLRRLQGALGDVHDAQVLVDGLDDLLDSDASSTDTVTLKALFEDDIARAHAEYVRRRERVFAIADACARAAASARAFRRQRRTLVAASVVAAPLLLAGGQPRR